MSEQTNEGIGDFFPQSWKRAAQDAYAPGMREVLDNLDQVEDLARQGITLSQYPTRQADRLSMKTLSLRVLEAVKKLHKPNLSLHAKKFHANWIRTHLAELQQFVQEFMKDEKAMKLMKQKADRDLVGRAVKLAKEQKPDMWGGRKREMEDSTTDPNRPRFRESFTEFLRHEMLTEEKYMCRNGHLHNSQDRATNCATCKRQERKRAEKAAPSTSK
jgi:hypothetical protein